MVPESPSDILLKTRESRLKIFFEKLDSNFDKFKDIIISGNVCHIPVINSIPNKRYCRSKVRLPISYETTVKYRIRLNNNIYDLYKNSNNYYFIDVISPWNLSTKVLIDFSATIQYSFVFYLFYTLLNELTSEGTTVELKDLVFTNLTDKFNTPGGRLKITMTPFSVKNKIIKDDHLYISLFN